MVMSFGSSQIPVAVQSVAPNSAAISQSDYCSITTKDATKVRLSRPIVDGQGFDTCNPEARIARFVTDSKTVVLRINFTGLVTRADTYNGIGWVLVNGVKTQSFNTGQAIGSTVSLSVPLSFGSNVNRTFEVLCPYCASIDFIGVTIEATASISPAASRPTTKLVCAGDSITHGFWATDESVSWPTLLAASKGYSIVNLGYGGRICYPTEGTTLGNLSPSVACYLIGYNDFASQEALATFKANYITYINNFRALCPAVKLYCITPTWTATVLAIPIESYRQQIRDALTTLGNPLNVLVEGTSLTTGGAGSFNADGIHPNDTGSAEIAAALATIVLP